MVNGGDWCDVWRSDVGRTFMGHRSADPTLIGLLSVAAALLLVLIVLEFRLGSPPLVDEDDRAEDRHLGADA